LFEFSNTIPRHFIHLGTLLSFRCRFRYFLVFYSTVCAKELFLFFKKKFNKFKTAKKLSISKINSKKINYFLSNQTEETNVNDVLKIPLMTTTLPDKADEAFNLAHSVSNFLYLNQLSQMNNNFLLINNQNSNDHKIDLFKKS
jgi:hypothetical protein